MNRYGNLSSDFSTFIEILIPYFILLTRCNALMGFQIIIIIYVPGINPICQDEISSLVNTGLYSLNNA